MSSRTSQSRRSLLEKEYANRQGSPGSARSTLQSERHASNTPGVARKRHQLARTRDAGVTPKSISRPALESESRAAVRFVAARAR